MESTRGIRTLVVVFESFEEMFACGCMNGKFNENFEILPLELKVKFIWMLSYVFLTVLDLPWSIYICYTSFMVPSPLKWRPNLEIAEN